MSPQNLVDVSSNIGDPSTIPGYPENVAKRTDVRWLDEREQRAWRALQLMHMQLTARITADLAATSDLSYSDYVVLVGVSERADGRMRLFELARTLGWEKSRVSHQIARMVDRGLVTKEKCGEDRRGANVVITARGRKAIEAAAPQHVSTVRRLFVDRLTAEELEAVGAAAEKILDVLARECERDDAT